MHGHSNSGFLVFALHLYLTQCMTMTITDKRKVTIPHNFGVKPTFVRHKQVKTTTKNVKIKISENLFNGGKRAENEHRLNVLISATCKTNCLKNWVANHSKTGLLNMELNRNVIEIIFLCLRKGNARNSTLKCRL